MKRILQIHLLSFLLTTIQAFAQESIVTGSVTSADDGNRQLPGVNVIVKGTTTGTVTDANGNYSISVPNSATALLFSFIGLKSEEIEIGQKSVLNVAMGVDVKQLSEIVITGVGVATEKRKLAIAVESVTADKLPIAPTASIDQALIGKIPGAQIQAIKWSARI
ncbi:MAG: carboxypeptidase-like regulatory domain-containing protein [Cytophagales bacterium]|nr:carboxypeptidase-like regulatory domain-containing protein [Cytophagales bacterium]